MCDVDSSMSSDFDECVRCREREAALRETRSALDEFQSSSKELERELERELAETEQQYSSLKSKNERLAREVTEWRYQSAKSESSTGMECMQREIDALREALRVVREQLRDTEVSNDDIERSERAAQSSLVDLQKRYNDTLTKNSLLEAELASKHSLEVEVQRLRDELRDSQVVPPSPPASDRARNSSENHSKSRRAMLDMVARVKSLEQRLQSCRSIVAPLIEPERCVRRVSAIPRRKKRVAAIDTS